MRAVVQRVSKAGVTIDGKTVGSISKGLAVLLGIGLDDNEKDIDYMVRKITNLRVFEDNKGKLNLSVSDIHGELLVVSQFTLYGDCRKGNRPSFDKAQGPEQARKLYMDFVNKCRETGLKVETGEFQAMMEVEIHNNGPVTILLDSNRVF